MKKYNKPLIEIKDYNVEKAITALEVSTSPINWTADETNANGYKEFEW